MESTFSSHGGLARWFFLTQLVLSVLLDCEGAFGFGFFAKPVKESESYTLRKGPLWRA